MRIKWSYSGLGNSVRWPSSSIRATCPDFEKAAGIELLWFLHAHPSHGLKTVHPLKTGFATVAATV